jgi:hypothetical protein
MGKIGRIYPRNEALYRNAASASGPFTVRSFFESSNDILMEMVHHPVTAGIVVLMFALGLIGWFVTFWIL